LAAAEVAVTWACAETTRLYLGGAPPVHLHHLSPFPFYVTIQSFIKLIVSSQFFFPVSKESFQNLKKLSPFSKLYEAKPKMFTSEKPHSMGEIRPLFSVGRGGFFGRTTP
jgi:hypothetical protein